MASHTPEQFYPSEENYKPTLSEKELLDIEKNIDRLHAENKANPNGVHIMESLSLPDSWLTFMEKGEELLGLSPEEGEHLESLLKKLLEGKLERADSQKLAKLKERFDALTTH